MAYLKISCLKSEEHLGEAINYITNFDKTEQGTLISSYMCSSDGIYTKKDFLDVHSLATKRGNNYAFHIIQSFSPDDNVTPQQALEIGEEFMKRAISDYQYVIGTHSDRKHIHNHIIFNSVDLIRHRKYHSNKHTLEELRKISDVICEEHNLSVITPTKLSQRIILRNDINSAIQQSDSYENFLKIMQSCDYEIKVGKYLYFRKQGNKNFINTKTLGTAYIEENIRAKVYDSADIKNHNPDPRFNYAVKSSQRKSLKRCIDIILEKSLDFEDFLKRMREQDYEVKKGKHLTFRHSTGKRFIRVDSLGYLYNEQILRLYFENNEEYEKIKCEIQTAVGKYFEPEKELYSRYIAKLNIDIGTQMINYLHENKLADNSDFLEKAYNAVNREKHCLREKEKAENQIKELTEGINALKIYHEYKDVYDEDNSLSNEKFEKIFALNGNQAELEEFNSALAVVNSFRKYDNSIPTIEELEKSIKNENKQIALYEKGILQARASLKTLENVKFNLQSIGAIPKDDELQNTQPKEITTKQKQKKCNNISR